MSNCIHQSQPVETSMEQEQASSAALLNYQAELFQSDQNAEILFPQLASFMKAASDAQFEDSLKLMNKLFAQGHSALFTKENDILKKMMALFIKLSKGLQNDSQAQSKMLFILSLIAEMIKESPDFYFPFTRKFLLTVFEIDNESLQSAPFKNQILAILSVVYNNLSLQGRLIKKLNVEKELKNALMTNYHLINQLFTLKLFNRSVLNLASKGVAFTSADFSKHGILDTITKFIAQNQVEMFLARMKSCMFQVKPQPQQAKKLVL